MLCDCYDYMEIVTKIKLHIKQALHSPYVYLHIHVVCLKKNNRAPSNYCLEAVVASYHLYLDIMVASISLLSFSTLNANISSTRSDTEKQSKGFIPILSDLTSEINTFLGVNFLCNFSYFSQASNSSS